MKPLISLCAAVALSTQRTCSSIVRVGQAVTAQRALIYVDPAEPEATTITAATRAQGALLIPVWSEAAADAICSRYSTESGLSEATRAAEAPRPGLEQDWAESRFGKTVQIAGVLCSSDAGLKTAERLQHVLAPAVSNGLLDARRDKFEMNEVLRRKGLPAAAQCAPADWEEALRFLHVLQRSSAAGLLRAVIKPRRGQASVLVGVATSVEQARSMYDAIRRSHISLDNSGGRASQPVIQEFLQGTEYVVDTVSADGVHKCVALWRYEKGARNGAPFVYLGDELLPAASEDAWALLRYAEAVLTALDWRWGPAHMELMLTSDGPRLVEVNAGRFNGGDFKLVTDVCVGYNAYEVSVDAYLRRRAFRRLPAAPTSLRSAGRIVNLVSHAEGILSRDVCAPAGLQSLVRFEPHARVRGERVRRTVDLDSCAGYAYLLHTDESIVARDYRAICNADLFCTSLEDTESAHTSLSTDGLDKNTQSTVVPVRVTDEADVANDRGRIAEGAQLRSFGVQDSSSK